MTEKIFNKKDRRDFKIKEYVKDKTTKYKIRVIINESDNDEVIDNIYIKEVE